MIASQPDHPYRAAIAAGAEDPGQTEGPGLTKQGPQAAHFREQFPGIR